MVRYTTSPRTSPRPRSRRPHVPDPTSGRYIKICEPGCKAPDSQRISALPDHPPTPETSPPKRDAVLPTMPPELYAGQEAAAGRVFVASHVWLAAHLLRLEPQHTWLAAVLCGIIPA